MDKLELYNKAKEAYYNGTPIMEDFEFDKLETELGLENKSYIGSKHNPSYTVQHPFIMGSLSKIQIKKDKNSEDINFGLYLDSLKKYVGNNKLIITPKYDGCSFEVQTSKSGKIKSISTRGDGEFGKDIKEHILDKVEKALCKVENKESCYRGEVLIDKNIFAQKYSEFVNPRSFVSGVLNRKFEGISIEEKEELKNKCNDLSIVIYDVRTKKNTEWEDIEWTSLVSDNIPDFYFENVKIETAKDFEDIYNKFSKYRETCKFALDGIVIKPVVSNRINNLTQHRPTDCVAIKFIPILEETEVIDIEWNLGKSGEYTPVVITNPVIMDGKSVTRANANNIGYLISNKISIGTKLVFSLAGDIIPFIYKVTDTSRFDEQNINLPENSELNGIHLIAVMSEEEKRAKELKYSILTLNIPGMGESNANTLVDYIVESCKGDEFFDEQPKQIPNNVFMIEAIDFEIGIGGKNGTKISKAYKDIIGNITLDLIIRSCNFKLCGEKVSEQIANKLLGNEYDFTSMASEAYEWCFDDNSKQMIQLNEIFDKLGFSLEFFKQKQQSIATASNDEDKIPVILTGEPNNYSTKAEFIKCNPQYRVTTKWKECKIVFTNSLDSNTGKMKQAKAKGIEIRVY